MTHPIAGRPAIACDEPALENDLLASKIDHTNSEAPPTTQAGLNGASTIRRRATADEMEERAQFLIDYATEHGPITVRGLYYQAEVAGIPGIDKSDQSYRKVQHQVLMLRRQGRLDYDTIADATRWMRKPKSHSSVEDALDATANLYRKSLWDDANFTVEVWCEKDALAGVIYPVTSEYDVPLMVTRGFSSETFAFEAVQAAPDDRPYVVLYLGDFDRAGQDAAKSLREKLERFAGQYGIHVFFHTLAVTGNQIVDLDLPTREPKRNTAADRKWPYPVACELDAIPPDELRRIVEDAINRYLPQDKLKILKVAEESERTMLRLFSKTMRRRA
jgi:hypothetical protein